MKRHRCYRSCHLHIDKQRVNMGRKCFICKRYQKNLVKHLVSEHPLEIIIAVEIPMEAYEDEQMEIDEYSDAEVKYLTEVMKKLKIV